MKKICIIGAGISGISAAIHLIENGFKVDIYESTDSVGGRISSIKDFKTGNIIDNGQHLLVGAYKRFLYLLGKFGTEKNLKILDGIDITYVDNKGSYPLSTGTLPGDLGALAGILSFKPFHLKDKIGLIALALKIKISKLVSDETCLEFLLRNNQTQNAIKYFWEPLVLATINNDLSSSPAQLLINVMKDAFFNNKKMSSLILPTSDLQNLLIPLEKFVSDNGSKLIKKTKISELLIDNENIKGVKLKTGEIIHYDYVISSLPPFSLKKIIPDNYSQRYFRFLSDFEYSPIISVYLWYDLLFPKKDIFALIGTTSQWVFNRNNFADNEDNKYTLLSVTISNADMLLNKNPKEISSIVHNEISELFDEIIVKSPIHSRVVIEKFATFRSDIKTEIIRTDNTTPIEGLYLAGDWTDTGYPATIEGAAISGWKTAKIISEKLI
jgi:squalene-associated FAD-dependent desaturase